VDNFQIGRAAGLSFQIFVPRSQIGMRRQVLVLLIPATCVLDKAEEYRGLAIRAKDRRERECYVRIVELYVEIAEELEALFDGWASP
jgi:hypothetical protein